jgi:DNA-binding MarR family transcriptional regulator
LVSGSFEALIAEQGVTVAQWSALITLYRGEAQTPADIARHIDVDPGALTRLLDRLESKGLIRRVRDRSDRRSVTIELTTAARKITPVLAGLADENDRAFFGVLSAAERRQFQRLLAKLLRGHNVETPAGWM